MKAKKLYMILLCVVFASPLFAFGKAPRESRIQQNTQNWTQQDVQTTSRDNAIDQDDLDAMNQDPNVPVGDTAWVLILSLGLTYGVYSFSKKRKEVKE